MAPAHVCGVLVVGVLAIVDQQVGVPGEVKARDPVVLEAVERRSQSGLVVGYVGQSGAAVGDPIAEGGAAVGDRLGRLYLAAGPGISR